MEITGLVFLLTEKFFLGKSFLLITGLFAFILIVFTGKKSL